MGNENFTAIMEAALARTNWADIKRIKESRAVTQRGTYRQALEGYPAEPQDSIDLHRMTIVEAEREVTRFLQQAHTQRLLTVLVITGKGNHSESGKARLRPAVARLLESLKTKRTIVDFQKEQGGGAFKVFLPRHR